MLGHFMTLYQVKCRQKMPYQRLSTRGYPRESFYFLYFELVLQLQLCTCVLLMMQFNFDI